MNRTADPMGGCAGRVATALCFLLVGAHVFGAAALLRPAQERQAGPELARLRIDPNTATAAELQLLPGVGPALAQNIIDHRSRAERRPAFETSDDLDAVPRIGPATIARLRDWLALPDASTYARSASSDPTSP